MSSKEDPPASKGDVDYGYEEQGPMDEDSNRSSSRPASPDEPLRSVDPPFRPPLRASKSLEPQSSRPMFSFQRNKRDDTERQASSGQKPLPLTQRTASAPRRYNSASDADFDAQSLEVHLSDSPVPPSKLRPRVSFTSMAKGLSRKSLMSDASSERSQSKRTATTTQRTPTTTTPSTRRPRLSAFAFRSHSVREMGSSSFMDSESGGSSSLSGGGSNHRMRTSLKASLVRRSRAALGHAAQEAAKEDEERQRAAIRRYRVGDRVLVADTHSKYASLVNRYGYPRGEGITAEEQQGPYLYVLATVKTVHFEEFAAYYTITRADTNVDQRADADFMEPLKTVAGEAAALRAATQTAKQMETQRQVAEGGKGGALDDTGGNCCLNCLQTFCYYPLLPFLCIYDIFYFTIGTHLMRLGNHLLAFLKKHAALYLNGQNPYVCKARITFVNFLVVCNFWYLLIDQARLAFFPPNADYSLAILNFVIWIVLALELICEIFIRPDGYKQLLLSEKAYSPTTVRFITTFHVIVESVSLVFFTPEFLCLLHSDYVCGDRMKFSFFNAVLLGIAGQTRRDAFLGRAFFMVIRFRIFGLVRHWTKMSVKNTIVQQRRKFRKSKSGRLKQVHPDHQQIPEEEEEQKNRDAALINASNIGTALMVTGSYRALVLFCSVAGLLPIIFTLSASTGTNRVSKLMTFNLQQTNLLANDTSNQTCEFLADSLASWLPAVEPTASRAPFTTNTDVFLLRLALEPFRCEHLFSVGGDGYDGTFTSEICDLFFELDADGFDTPQVKSRCSVWTRTADAEQVREIAKITDLRPGAIVPTEFASDHALTIIDDDGSIVGTNQTEFRVLAHFNYTQFIEFASLSSFLLQLTLIVATVAWLRIVSRDAEVLVLGPIRRMLKIVQRYAVNPLASSFHTSKSHEDGDGGGSDDSSGSDSDADGTSAKDQLGNFETEQLITAVSKITDLLRKCWGVAGADIISTNLATSEGSLTEVFNPTVPGRSVYALFGFAAISGFDHALRCLGGDVMILINDVARVLHDEVFRWGFGDSGQCNKNLGSAFLMVFRIGLVKEVIKKLEQAEDVVFSGAAGGKIGRLPRGTRSAKKPTVSSVAMVGRAARAFRLNAQRSVSTKAMSLSLQSLPGISTFTDRAVIGMLKSFAGIYRDKKLRGWKNDFRLGAGVGAFSVDMIFGMDAGWAVEGAVGSEYKIDATYLSPHVNMASRMMSACKQYGVSILLSQAVEELMSDVARSKLRHLDTVTVKGSSVRQKIFTYDARHQGVDFFLFGRPDDQADLDAERYSPNMWNVDQDMRAMRQHISDEFMSEFDAGRKAYLAGDWTLALKRLEAANEIMVDTIIEEGYMEDAIEEMRSRAMDESDLEQELRAVSGDGPSVYLINFIKSKGGVAPSNWAGWHPLLSK